MSWTKEPHNDGNWHHLAFVRDKKQDTLTIYIDGVVEDSQNGKKQGSPTKGQEFGIHLGQRVDGQNKFKGFLDEYRLWTRALSKTEIKKIIAGTYKSNIASQKVLLNNGFKIEGKIKNYFKIFLKNKNFKDAKIIFGLDCIKK